MNIKRLLHNRKMRTVLSIALIVAILLGLWIPGAGINTVQPQEPSLVEEAHAYDSLTLGEREQIDESKDDREDESDKGGMSKDEKVESEESDKEESENESEDKEGKKQDTTETESEDEGTGDGDDGNEDGSEGEEGDVTAEQTLSMVMTWYKYGRQPKTIVCSPSETVSGDINTAQLEDNRMKYKFSLTGEEAKNAKVTAVSVKEGNSAFTEIDENGKITIDLPNAAEGRTYTFLVEALWKTKDADGRKVEQEVTFTYEIRFAYALDLELELSWAKSENRTGKVTIAANEKVAKTIESGDIDEQQFNYTPKLTGKLAEGAELISGEYTTASGESGKLDVKGGTLQLKGKGNANKETYHLTFTAEAEDSEGMIQKVYYHMTLVYLDVMDVDVAFTWLEKGTLPKTMVCRPDSKVSTDIRNNQLSAGAVKYEIKLTGNDIENARILGISYKSQAGSSGSLTESGALPMILPAGEASNTYTITVMVLSAGRQIKYEIDLKYAMDVQLAMTYDVNENGNYVERTVLCENGKTEVADAVYDDQLKDGLLSYKMSTTGNEKLTIKNVKCYQSGSGSMVKLNADDHLKLLLDKGKTGENTFYVTAEDKSGTEYQFTVMIPYKHRGENLIRISTNMTNGQVVTNETNTNLSVSAWSEDENGNVVSYIPANGEDTKLIVKLDGKTLKYVSSSGPASEFILYPENPVKGDTNEHTLYIYAEDPYGNYGELTLKLKGQRQDAGQKKGKATIRIDLTVLGLGIVDSVAYEIMADEPISYSIAKAVLGMDTGEPFGEADNALGWKGKYLGTLDTGFYLKSLTPGIKGKSLNGSSWNKYGSSEQQILKAIDAEFGEGTGLATLWRCIYRNGLNKSAGTDGTYGEFDFTSGSGWLYSLNGTYFPGLSMSEYRLEDGDVLTLRYTLAHGWEVGGGTTGYGKTVGYCVAALDGKFYINHQMEDVENEDGSISHICRCCGLEEGCLHENMGSRNLGDGTHVAFCKDCKKTIGNPEMHTWKLTEKTHECTACGAAEEHEWKEEKGSNTATCTKAGTRKVFCTTCNMSREEASPARGHTLNKRWNHTETEHYQKCSVCSEIISESKGTHQYVYHKGDDDWYCKVCDAGHDWDYCGNSGLKMESATCSKILYFCPDCELRMIMEGDFSEHHNYENGKCVHCGTQDPEHEGPEESETN